MPDVARESLQNLLQQAKNRGLLIEAGWLACYIASIPKDLSTARIAELRAIFFAGAAHVFESLIKPSATDIKQVAMIQSELQHEHARQQKPSRPTIPRKRSR